MWISAPVLFPTIPDAALRIWSPDRNKMRMVATVLSLSEAICSWLIILSYLGMRLSLWNIGLGVELCLRLDGIGALFSGLASLIWVLVAFFAFEHVEHEREEARFFGYFIMSLGTPIGAAYIGNFITLYLFFEMMTFFGIPPVFHSGKRGALRVGMVHLAYSMLGASIALGDYFFFRRYACGMDFKAGGTLMGTVGTAQDRPQIILLSIFCIAAGSSCKIGLMLLHPWLPIVHPAVPAPTSAMLSGLITRAGVVAVIQVVYGMASPIFPREAWVQHALLFMIVLTIFTGSALAYEEKELKRRLTCSSSSQVPYVLFGIFLLSMEGLYGPLFQMVFHTLIKNALFLCTGAVICETGCVRIKKMRGMGGRMPAVMLCFALVSPSLVGVPPADGFPAEWHLAAGAMRTEAGLFTWPGPAVLMISVLLTAGYLFPVIVEGFFLGKGWKKAEESEAGRSCVGASAVSVFIKMPLVVLGTFLLVLDTLRRPVFELLRGIASAMM